ncbi:7TM GPCR protein [Aphelenchoides avenae]|nr:7TM GPCR protein [Aphelenchus avenae]
MAYKAIAHPKIVSVISECSSYLLLAISPACYIVLVYVVCKSSPNEMRAYKWYILLNATYATAYDVFYSLTRAEPLFPYPVFLGKGPLVNRPLPDWVMYFNSSMICFLLLGNVYQTTSMFLFRYSQTVDNVLYRTLSNAKTFVAVHIGGIALLGSLTLLPVTTQWSSRGEMLESARNDSSELYAEMQRTSFLGLKETEENSYLFRLASASLVAIGVAFVVIIAYSTYGCYRHMTRHSASFSVRTLKLYRVLLNALVIDMLACVLMVAVPMVASTVAVGGNSENGGLILLLSFTIANWYPLVNNVVTLSYITPYRRSLLRLVNRIRVVSDSPAQSDS